MAWLPCLIILKSSIAVYGFFAINPTNLQFCYNCTKNLIIISYLLCTFHNQINQIVYTIQTIATTHTLYDNFICQNVIELYESRAQ